MCTHQTNSKHWFRTELTRCHESNSFHSWLPINSINSPKTLPVPPRPCPRRPPWVCGYLLLWQPLARCHLSANTTPWQRWGGKIDSRENKEDSFFFFSFCCRGAARAEGKSPSSAFQNTAPLLQGACNFTVEPVTTLSSTCDHRYTALIVDKWGFFLTVNTTTSLYLNYNSCLILKASASDGRNLRSRPLTKWD